MAAAAIAWSTAPFFTRLLHFDSWTILFWRGLFGGGFIALFLVLAQGWHGARSLIRLGAGGALVACLSALAMLAFIPALQLTSTANVAIVIAAQPFTTTAIAWLWLREAPSIATMLASLVAFSGIAVTVSGAVTAADYRAVGLAVVMMLAFAAMTVAMRRHKDTPMVAAAAVSNVLGATISVPFAHDLFAVSALDIGTLAMFGLFQVALGLTFFSLGVRLLPSGRASLIATLETPLMPFWVWLAFAELPSGRALAGGALVMTAVIADIVGNDRKPKLG
ncbi:DMT family transporter [Bradyrhizobium ontarionense]|uniref:DMT family transporter n=1 Tax=Bradyrhizobium ontarionense TaxID=2898149 RepID=A0ABY3RN48_9BRAD|nr:DMT family transporter [Bradyrhizobium sp. A19]UFZ08118.1 DMT family transporter [Bradyrhizobium sp. A19]